MSSFDATLRLNSTGNAESRHFFQISSIKPNRINSQHAADPRSVSLSLLFARPVRSATWELSQVQTYVELCLTEQSTSETTVIQYSMLNDELLN